MTRERRWFVAAVAGAVGLMVLFLWGWQRRAALSAVRPSWTDPGQPPDGVAAELNSLTDDQSWAANRCRNMSACTPGQTAGYRIHRTYPDQLAGAPDTLVRARVALIGGQG